MEPSSMKELLKDIRTIAVIGCSSSPYRTSYHIAEYLADSGFIIIPVNPNEKKVLGRKAYPSVFDIPESVKIDLIDIFRNKRYTPEMVDEIVRWSKKTGQKPLIWTQLDVSTEESKKNAEENGFKYIENRCLMVEHRIASDVES